MQRRISFATATFLTSALLISGCAKSASPSVLAPEPIATPTLDDAIDDAAQHVGDATDAAQQLDEDALDLRGRFLDAVQQEDWARAEELGALWTPDASDVDGLDAHLSLQIARGEFAEARTQALAYADANPDQRDHWKSRWFDTWTADEQFWRATPYPLELGRDLDGMEALGGGSTITLKVIKDGEIVGVFKPHSTREQSNYRGEVAAYRLCALMQCGFEVPKNIEAKIRVRDFLRAYGIASLQRNKGYSRGFSDLITFKDEQGEEWIHGTLKDWAPGFTTFPIEHTDGWVSLLNGATSRARLEDMSLSDALRGMRGKERAYVGAMLDRGGDTDGMDFARQLSNLHVFDYLLNNWDRYSGKFWGVNCQWNHGHFVSIDNGAVLQRRSWGSAIATRNRMRRVRVFSRTTVDAIRWMDKEQMRTLLLPANPNHTDEEERFENFWERRNEFLTWIDQLIESRGEDKVLMLP